MLLPCYCKDKNALIYRWEPTRAPGPWDGVMQAITSGPVCPQSLPSFPLRNHVTYGNGSSTSDSSSSILEMPRPRLRFLQWIRTQLLRQSEDCLYLNLFVPSAALQPKRKKGKQIRFG